MPRVVFNARFDDAGKLYWQVEEQPIVSPSGLPIDELVFLFKLDGHLKGPEALEKVTRHLELGDISWLQTNGRKAIIFVKSFQDWLFGSEYIQWRKTLKWLSEDTMSLFEREWDLRRFKSKSLSSATELAFVIPYSDFSEQWSRTFNLPIRSGMDKSIEPGDRVRVRTGGPSMTVERMDTEYNLIECVWFDGIRVFRKSFGPNVLEKIPDSTTSPGSIDVTDPPEIRDSLRKFKTEHPEPHQVAFIMMRFSESESHKAIVDVVKKSMSAHKITAMRADDKGYHTDVFPNIKTYMHGCGFGIAVYERIETDDANPNVALEVGYMYALGKPVLLLKDKTLKTMPADLSGKIYHPFDATKPSASLPTVIKKWLTDNDLATK